MHNFKPFYVHFHKPPSRPTHDPRGFTALVSPGADDRVVIQLTKCSGKDAFCRKTGREQAAQKPAKLIPIDHLPHFFSKRARKIDKKSEKDYSYLLKYTTPKTNA